MGLNAGSAEGGARPAWQTPALEFTAGLVGGFFGKLVEYPLDTVKVKEQNIHGKCYNPSVLENLHGSYRIFVATVKKGGWPSLYDGLPLPLLAVCLESSILFSVHGRVKSWFQDGTDRELSVWEHALGGAAAGLVATPVLSPVELVKVRMQTAEKGEYRNSWHCLTHSIRSDGFGVLTRGLSSTFIREIPGSAAYFGVYELIMKLFMRDGTAREDVHPLKIMLAGGFGGAFYWLVPYPIDCAKTVIQAAPASARAGLVETLEVLYQTGGLRRLYQGVGISMIRAFPGNGTMFLGFETCMQLFRDQGLLD